MKKSRPVIGDRDAYRFRSQRRAGNSGFRSAVGRLAGPRAFTISQQSTLSGGGGGGASGGGFSSMLPFPDSDYAPPGGGGTSADDSCDPLTGVRYFVYGFSLFGGPDVTGP